MKDHEFELLLAMMRILKMEDGKSASLETAISNIIDSFEPHLTDIQKNALMKDFVRYAEKLQKKKDAKETEKRLSKEKYREILADYFSRDMGW